MFGFRFLAVIWKSVFFRRGHFICFIVLKFVCCRMYLVLFIFIYFRILFLNEFTPFVCLIMIYFKYILLLIIFKLYLSTSHWTAIWCLGLFKVRLCHYFIISYRHGIVNIFFLSFLYKCNYSRRLYIFNKLDLYSFLMLSSFVFSNILLVYCDSVLLSFS